MQNDLLTNKNAGALLRDSELDVVKHAEPPIDLRTVPLEQWDNYIGRDVSLSPFIASCIKPGLHHGAHYKKKAVETLEEMVEHHHGVKPPYYIAMSITMQQTGRPWAYVPEAGQYLTGLTLGKTVEAGVSPANE